MTLDQVTMIEAALDRNTKRCLNAIQRAVYPVDRWSASVPRYRLQDTFRDWYREREKEITKHLAAAINDCDQIIGKHWHMEDALRRLRIPPLAQLTEKNLPRR